MMLKVTGAIRRLMGWCPMAGSVRTEFPVQHAATAAPGGQDGVSQTWPGWWYRHHNQLLIIAIAFSAVTVALTIPVGDASKYPAAFTGIAIGTGSVLGFLLGYRKQYARIAAGEFRRENMSRRLRITRALSLPVAAVLFVALTAYLVQNGMFTHIFGFMLGLSLSSWALFVITVLWERRHRMIMIAERGSMYTLDTAIQEETLWH